MDGSILSHPILSGPVRSDPIGIPPILPLRLLSWNINGIFSLLGQNNELPSSSSPSSFQNFFSDASRFMNASILCFQEVKTTRKKICEAGLATMEDWECYYSFSRAHRKESYSGVATFVRRQVGTSLIRVVAAEEGLSGLLNPDQPSHPNDGSSRSSYGGGGYISHYGDLFKEFDRKELARLDDEGRVLITDHQSFVLVNVYCPALTSDDRWQFKMDFLRALQLRCEALIAAGRQVILVGDLNVCHREIDHCDPGRSVSERGIDSFQDSGERKWLARLLVNSKEVEKIKTSCGYRGDTSNCTDSEKEEAGGGDGDGFGGGGDEMGQGHFVDSFRFCHPTLKSAFSCWNTLTDARAGNYGTRIDYILVTRGLVSLVQDCFIASQVTGSDHAPVVCTLSGTLSSSSTDTNTTPDICSSNWPEVKGGKQAKINAFFGRKQRNDLTHTITTNNNHNNPTISSSSSKASSSSIASGNIGGGPKSKKKQQQQQQSSIYRFITSTRPSTSSKPTPESSSSVLAAYSPFSSSQEDVGGGGGGASSSTSVLISENELAALMAIPDIDQPPTPKKRENTNNDNGEEYINDISSSQDQLPSTTTKRAKLAWDRFLRAPDPPKCHHNESCKSFNVNKPGVNQGRKFWLCSRPVGEGYMDNKKIKGGGSGGESQGNCVNEFRCNFFMWHSVWVSKQPKRE